MTLELLGTLLGLPGSLLELLGSPLPTHLFLQVSLPALGKHRSTRSDIWKVLQASLDASLEASLDASLEATLEARVIASDDGKRPLPIEVASRSF